MSVDVVDLREFYATPLGKAAAHSINLELSKFSEQNLSGTVLGIGYCVPFLDALSAEGAICLMPARQGALQWPNGASSRTALVDEDELPISNSSVDLLIMVHLLENVADPADTLEEAWRVLAPEGKIIIVASHRSGPWARFERTPFGNGRPFSNRQMHNLLRDAKLTPIVWSSALNFPPLKSTWLLKLRSGIEKIVCFLVPAFSGVIVVEATKRLYQGIPASSSKQRKILVPVLSPQAAPRADVNRTRDYD